MEFDKLVYKLGSLHSILRELEAADLYQGEHTVAYTGADGTKQILHIYIDGTDLQMSNTPGSFGLNMSLDVFSED